MKPQNPDAHAVRAKVQAGYKAIALDGSERRKSSCCSGMSGVDSDKLARHLGYSAEELAGLPESANIGLSCGNPGALAALQPGETLLDLGSGAGFDAFIAGPKVGGSGRVIGVDMTAEMLTKARKNVSIYRERTGLDNVEFRLGEIENTPVADGSVDAIISNCVINLAPDKAQVWREIARVLRPGGRVAESAERTRPVRARPPGGAFDRRPCHCRASRAGISASFQHTRSRRTVAGLRHNRSAQRLMLLFS